jgi:hypothetical protein
MVSHVLLLRAVCTPVRAGMQAIQFIESGIVPQKKLRKNSTKIREMFQASALFCDDFLEQRGTH